LGIVNLLSINGRVRTVLHTCQKMSRLVVLALHQLSPVELHAALAGLGKPRNSVVMVHSSLSACGYVPGGAAAVIDALRTWCAGSTLAMPTHTYCYPASDGSVSAFDPTSTPSVVGAITDAFWRRPGVVRSLHPTHSLAADGSMAAELIAEHEQCNTPCGSGTPYHRLVQWDAAVLMFGVRLDCYTLFHTAEDAANVPYLYENKPYVLQVREPTGEVRDFPLRRQDMKVPRRFVEMDKWLENRGLCQRWRCGRGELLWVPHTAAVHATLCEALQSDPWLLTRVAESSHGRHLG
jgi:aminoglycoside 3-N-acetyltransferase